MPAATVNEHGSTPAVVHSPGCAIACSSTWTKNIVEPYISIRSPGSRTPALNASAHASTVPALTGVPSAQAGLLGRRGADRPDGLPRPGEPRQLESRRDLLRPVGRPAPRVQVVERVALARRVVVEHVLARQPRHHERVRAVPAAGALPDLGLVAPDPRELRADRLRGELLAAALEDRVRAEAPGQLLDLRRGAHVDPVEDRGAQRPDVLVAHQQARPEAGHADARDPRVARLRDQLLQDGDDVAPPVRLGVHLGPARPRQRHRVRARRGRHDRAVGGGEHALRAARPHVDPRQQLPHAAYGNRFARDRRPGRDRRGGGEFPGPRTRPPARASGTRVRRAPTMLASAAPPSPRPPRAAARRR